MGDFNMYANDLGFVVTNEATFLTTIVKEYKEEGVSVSVTLSGVGSKYIFSFHTCLETGV